MLVYLVGSFIAVAIFSRWSWIQVNGKDITLSDLTFFIFVSCLIGVFSWAAVFIWLFNKLDKYGDKVIIRRKKKIV